MNRREAEAITDHMHEVMMKSLKDSGVKIMTAEDRERLGVPDIHEALRESAIEAAMHEELSDEGQVRVDQMLTEKRRARIIKALMKGLTCGCGEITCGQWNGTSTRAMQALEEVDFS